MNTEERNKLKDFWDCMAVNFTDFEIPTPYNNQFMKLLYIKGIFECGGKALDIGCGAGKYTIALSKFFDWIDGIDISEEMIKHANTRKINENIKNIGFNCMLWQDLDVERVGWLKKYNFAFAHMTPAVNDEATIQKLRAVSKKWCAVTKSVYRRNEIAETVNDICEVASDGYGENELLSLMRVLWRDGLSPEIFYEKEVWENQMKTDRAIETYIKRMSVKHELSEKNKREISDYFNTISIGEVVIEKTDTVICTVYWNEEMEDK